MIEQVFRYTTSDNKTLERVVQDEAVHVNHMVLPRGEGFPEHVANANVYMTVLRGQLLLRLGEQEIHEYQRGDVLKIPKGTNMKGENHEEETVELLVVKSFA